MLRKIVPLLITVTVWVALISCSQDYKRTLSFLDTPGHHTYAGIKLMSQNKYTHAKREFERALSLNPDYSMALAGYAIVEAHEGNYQKAFSHIEKAEENVKEAAEKVFTHIGFIRVFTMSKKLNWQLYAEEHFQKALAIDTSSSSAYYFMGIACKEGLNFKRAALLFNAVLDLNDDHVEEAVEEWKLIQAIQKAKPESVNARLISIKEAVTRAEIATLLVEELKINRLYDERGLLAQENEKRTLLPSDIKGHCFQRNIEKILQINIKGLEVNRNSKEFKPDELMTRATYATIIADILEKLGKKEEMKSFYNQQFLQFSDVRTDNPYYDAVDMVTSLGIMKVRNQQTGEFSPFGKVSGLRALEILNVMQKELPYY